MLILMMRFLGFLAASALAGTGLATVLALSTASVYAAIAKSRAGIDVPVYEEMHKLAAPVFNLDLIIVTWSPSVIHLVATFGFLVGTFVMFWMFYLRPQSQETPEESGLDDRSEV